MLLSTTGKYKLKDYLKYKLKNYLKYKHEKYLKYKREQYLLRLFSFILSYLPECSSDVYCCFCRRSGVLFPQSSQQPLQILGAGFKGEPVLNFDPPIWAPDNYTVTVVSEDELKLELADGSLWSKYGGTLMVKGINVGDGEVTRRNGNVGVCSFLVVVGRYYVLPAPNTAFTMLSMSLA